MASDRPIYLSICAIYRNEARFLREWIEFHRLVGVERFYLYDNESDDEHRELLAPYVESGLVELEYWPGNAGQYFAYIDCIKRKQDESRWIAFIDLDEFLFSPSGRPLPELLRAYEEFPGLAVSSVRYGTSGHRARPEAPVTESYVRRVEATGRFQTKSVVDPRRVLHPGIHRFRYRDGVAVDENKRPVPDTINRNGTIEIIRLNHYVTKSEEEWAAKKRRPFAHMFEGRAQQNREDDVSRLNAVEDRSIHVYLPALRAALGLAPETGAPSSRQESSSKTTMR